MTGYRVLELGLDDLIIGSKQGKLSAVSRDVDESNSRCKWVWLMIPRICKILAQEPQDLDQPVPP